MTDSHTLTRGHWLVLGASFLGWMFDGVEIGLFPIVVRPAFTSLGLTDDVSISWWISFVTAAFLLGLAALALAGQSRTYARPLETTWDEAVKAVRDVAYYVSDSKRDEHWFVFQTRRKGGHVVKVSLSGGDQVTTVQVAAVDPADDEDAAEHVTKYLAALDKRMD